MRFETTLSAFGNNTGIEVPAGVLDALAAGRRPAVVVTVNGYTYRSTVGAMRGLALIPFSSDKRAETGLAGGDAITVDVVLDTAPRTVEVPDDLAAALGDLRGAFDALAPSRQKAHVAAVESAKAAATRERRVAAVVDSLR